MSKSYKIKVELNESYLDINKSDVYSPEAQRVYGYVAGLVNQSTKAPFIDLDLAEDVLCFNEAPYGRHCVLSHLIDLDDKMIISMTFVGVK